MKCYACCNEIQLESGKCPHCGFTIVRMTGDPYAYHEMMMKAAEVYRREQGIDAGNSAEIERMKQQVEELQQKDMKNLQEQSKLLQDMEELRKENERLRARIEAGQIEQGKEQERKRQPALPETEKKIKKHNKIIPSLIALTVMGTAAYFVTTKVIIPSNQYKEALALKEEGKYKEAIAGFEVLEGYSDSTEQISACETVIKDSELSSMRNTRVGDVVSYGAYEQDNDVSNGKEAIEWIVLDRKDDKALLISKYGLDTKQFNEELQGTSWKDCTLRRWMNDTFYKEAFTESEQSVITTAEVAADKNPEYKTDPGSNTNDSVFLLSIPEAKTYFTSNEARGCKPTDYAKKQGAYSSSEGNCWWWLRSPGDHSISAANVRGAGSLCYDGLYVNVQYACVRPALWIDLEP